MLNNYIVYNKKEFYHCLKFLKSKGYSISDDILEEYENDNCSGIITIINYSFYNEKQKMLLDYCNGDCRICFACIRYKNKNINYHEIYIKNQRKQKLKKILNEK